MSLPRTAFRPTTRWSSSRAWPWTCGGQRYETLDDLLLYCYRVAGTVGLMMTHVMGVSNEKALSHAAAMGMGMQLTNIARDLIEDHERGRIYLPLSWLAEAGLPPEELALTARRRKLAGLARRLLAVAGMTTIVPGTRASATFPCAPRAR